MCGRIRPARSRVSPLPEASGGRPARQRPEPRLAAAWGAPRLVGPLDSLSVFSWLGAGGASRHLGATYPFTPPAEGRYAVALSRRRARPLLIRPPHGAP